MKITFIVSGNIHSNFSYRALALARSLHKIGYETSIIAPSADKYNKFVPVAVHSIDGVKIVQPFQFATKRMEINLLPYMFSALKKAVHEKPDVVYIYKPTPITAVGIFVKLFRKTTIILDMDDLGSEVMRIEGHPWYQRKLVEWSEKFCAKHANYLVVASSYLFQKYTTQFPNKPIHIMPNGVESDWFEALMPTQEKKRIVFMGSINRKTILEPLFEVLPEIIKLHSDVSVLIIGDGKYLEYFREKAKDLKIATNIKFTGWLPLAQARSLLRAGDIGYNYMPDEVTIKAASNMKVPQYMSRGVVPLVSNIGDLPANVQMGNAGYICEAGSLQNLKQMLLYGLLEDKQRRQKSGFAQAFALEKFNWDHLASSFSHWLLSLMKADKDPISQKI